MAPTVSSAPVSYEQRMLRNLEVALHTTGADASSILDILADLIERRAWTVIGAPERTLLENEDDYEGFRRLVVSAYPDGLGTTPDNIRKIVDLEHKKERGLFQEPATGERMRWLRQEVTRLLNPAIAEHGGNRKGGQVNNVNLIPEQGGNARSYTVRRLQRDRPDLAEQVIRKQKSANAAAIEAGFRKKPTPLERLQKLWQKASEEERLEFVRWIHRGGAQ